ncbi:MAG: hypothetical protein ACJ8EH_01725 [Sphingomicrobium sp.]
MSEESDRFRTRARECRQIAAKVKDESWAQTLTDIADELDEEADKIDREDR